MFYPVEYALPKCEIELSKEMKHYKSKDCIVLIEGKTPEIAYYNTGQFSDNEDPWFSWICTESGDIVENVTHWTFIPGLPSNGDKF